MMNDTNETSIKADLIGQPSGNRFTRFFKTMFSPLDGMRHIFLAFALSFLLQYVIYIAMKVWPFGDSSVLILDLNAQYVYFFEEMRDMLCGESSSLLYSFQRALGGEFLGMFAYYLSSPFTFIVALFPEGMITEALFILFLLKCGLSGMNMCIYLHKSHPTKPTTEVAFSVLYALCGYAVVMQHNTMWFDCVLFLPLILLGVESLIKERKYKLYTITLGVALFSNFYIGYMICIFVFLYFFFYYFMCTPEERNPLGEKFHFPKTFGRMALFSGIGVGMAAAIILPAYYSLTFGKTTFSNPNFKFGLKFHFLDFLGKFLPLSYDTVRPEGLPFVYVGTLVLILLPIFFISRKISARKKIAYGIFTTVMLASFMITTFDLVWHGLQKPNWLNYRYSFMFCFLLIVMAYLIYEKIDRDDFAWIIWAGTLVLAALVLLRLFRKDTIKDDLSFWVTLGLTAVLAIFLIVKVEGWISKVVPILLVVVISAEALGNGIYCTYKLGKDVIFSKRNTYTDFIDKWSPIADWMNENDSSFFRSEKTDIRKTNDNFTLNLNGLSTSTSTLNASQITFLNRLGYYSKAHKCTYYDGTPVNNSLLGLKYILARPSDQLNDLYGDAIYVDRVLGTMLYQNPYALPLGYMVNESVETMDMAAFNTPFKTMNALVGKMVNGGEAIEVFKPYTEVETTPENVKETYTVGHDHKVYEIIDKESRASVSYTFTTVNDRELFVYFPSKYPRGVNLYANGKYVSQYFTTETQRIVSLGKFDADAETTVRIGLLNDNSIIYLGEDENYFWYVDEDLFRDTFVSLQQNGYEIEDGWTDDHFKGKVTATEEKSLFLLTIPYDEGWKVYVDGEQTEITKALDALIAVKLTPGEHEIELRYLPDCVVLGTLITLGCDALLVNIIVADIVIKKKKKKAEVPVAEEPEASEE